MASDEPDSFSRHSSRSSSDSAGPHPPPHPIGGSHTVIGLSEPSTVRRLPKYIMSALQKSQEDVAFDDELDWGDHGDEPFALPSSSAKLPPALSTAAHGTKHPSRSGSGRMKTFALTDANLALHAQAQQAKSGRFFQPHLQAKARKQANPDTLDELDGLEWGEEPDIGSKKHKARMEDEDEKQRTLTLTKGQPKMFAKSRTEPIDGLTGLRGVPNPKVRPGADALDGLDDLDIDNDEEGEGADTLRADPATFRAALLAQNPSALSVPAPADGHMSTGHARAGKQTTPPTQDNEEVDFLADLDIPVELDLTALTLEEKKRSRRSGPRSSVASAASSGSLGVVSPTHSSSGRSAQQGVGGNSEGAAESPRSMTSGRSAQSLTSAISSVMTPSGPSGSDERLVRGGRDSPVRMTSALRDPMSFPLSMGTGEDEEDMEDGLELGKAFFSTGAGAIRDLEKKLDRRRRAGLMEPTTTANAIRLDSAVQPALGRQGKEMEDGLVLDDEADLSRRQLSRSRHLRQTTRGLPARPALPLVFGETDSRLCMRSDPPLAGAGGQQKSDLSKWRERDPSGSAVSQRERERTLSTFASVGMGGEGGRGSMRSQSAAATIGPSHLGEKGSGTLGRGTSRRLADLFSPSHTPGLRKESTRVREFSGENRRARSGESGLASTEQTIPTPALIPPSSVSRLRHQKSHFQLPSAASGSTPGRLSAGTGTIRRKQSLDILPKPAGGRERGVLSPPSSRLQGLQGIRQTPLRAVNDAAVGVRDESRAGPGSGFTLPTLSSLSKTRPALQGVFDVPLPGLPSRNLSGGSAGAGGVGIATGTKARPSMAQKLMGLPRRGEGKGKVWGDGTELDGLDDLAGGEEKEGQGNIGSVDRKKGSDLSVRSRSGEQNDSIGSSGRGKARTKSGGSQLSLKNSPGAPGEKEKSKASGSGSLGRKRGKKGMPSLIRNMGGVDKPKVVQGMMWDPVNLRWEGNESALAAFDGPVSARPALITPYAVGHALSPAAVPQQYSSHPHKTSGSPKSCSRAQAFSGNAPDRRQFTPQTMARIEGNMRFDPERMCWLSIDPGEEEDPFGDLSEDDFGATLTKAQGAKLVAIGLSSAAMAERLVSQSTMSTYTSISASSALSGVSQGSAGTLWSHFSRGSEASTALHDGMPIEDGVGYVTQQLILESREAEERHKREMKGWVWGNAGRPGMVARMSDEEQREREKRERKRLWEVRKVARSS